MGSIKLDLAYFCPDILRKRPAGSAVMGSKPVSGNPYIRQKGHFGLGKVMSGDASKTGDPESKMGPRRFVPHSVPHSSGDTLGTQKWKGKGRLSLLNS